MKILALDVGGTNLKFGVFDENLKTEKSGEIPSEAKAGAEKLLENIFSVCESVRDFDLLGVSTAGMVAQDGSIAYANENIPRYTGVKLREILQNRFGVDTFVLNDIAAGAMAEAEGEESFYYLSLGTGVGGIMVEKGLPVLGAHGIAGQIGYLPSLSGSSAVDKAASASALERTGEDRAENLFARAERGDCAAKEALSRWAKEVMHAVAFVVGFYDPKRVVFGGGISKQKQTLIKYLLLEEEVLPEPYRGKAVLDTARNASGIVGAAKYALARYRVENKEN